MPRRKRILEKLAVAPPLPPKPASEAQIAAQLAKDTTTREILVHKLGPILDQLKKKHRKNVLSANVSDRLCTTSIFFVLIPYLPNLQDAFMIHALRVNAAAQLKEQQAQQAAEEATAHQAVLDEVSRNAPDPLDAFAGQANGEDVNMEPPTGEVVPNGVHDGVLNLRLASPFDQPAANGTVEDVPSTPAERVIKKPHYVDFDLVQNKLIDSNHGYLSLQAFQRDIERMAENVTMLQDDLDRRAKAHAMVIEAKLLIKDYFQDDQQKADIEAMAVRERVRRRGNKTKGSSPATSAKGTRQSARVSGSQPEFNHRALAELEAAKRKRQRESSGSGTSAMEAGSAAKRPRTEEEANGIPTHDSAVMQSGHAMHVDAVEGSTNAVPGSSMLPSLAISEAQLAIEDIQPIQEATPPPPSPPPPPPPFILPEVGFHSLTKLISESTFDFNIEELEQLRALLMQRIWKRRADWDRTELIEEMTRAARNFLQQVTHARRAQRHE